MTVRPALDRERKLASATAPQNSAAPRLRYIALGVLLLQVTWIFAVVPFRGSDEFDHAYRAAAVAHGQWVAPPSAATRGTGAWVDVPHDIVAAAHSECARLQYTTAHDCRGTRRDGYVRVASGAGRYNPLFYAVIGYPARAFSGAAALMVMRGVTALCCWLVFLMALGAIRTWSRSRWPAVAALIACTPVLLYSSSIASPNGLEMMAALAFWSALIGLAVTDGSSDHYLLRCGTLAACILVTLRPLGPLWCLLALISVLFAALPPGARVRQVLVRRATWVASGIVGLFAVGSVVWTESMGSLVIGKLPPGVHVAFGERVAVIAQEVPLWLLQSIAAFPLRSDPTHPAVYVCYLGLGIAVMALAYRAATRRLRLAIVTTVLVSILVPALITFTTLERYGTSWQGRYGLPYSIGALMLAGLALDRRRPQRHINAVMLTFGLLFVAAQTISAAFVVTGELQSLPRESASNWMLHSSLVIAALGVASSTLAWVGAARKVSRASNATQPAMSERVID